MELLSFRPALITGGNCIVQINELFINGVPYALQSALSTYSVNSIPCLDNFSVSGGQQTGVEQTQCPFGATCGLTSDAYFQCSWTLAENKKKSKKIKKMI